MKLREIREEDLDKLSVLHIKTWQASYVDILPGVFLQNLDRGKWRNRMKKIFAPDSKTLGYTIEIDGILIGDIIFGENRHKEYEYESEIYAINILPEYQKKGLGKKMITKAFLRLKEEYKNTYLLVLEKNTNARLFYEKMGFINNDKKRIDVIGGESVVECIYEYSFKE